MQEAAGCRHVNADLSSLGEAAGRARSGCTVRGRRCDHLGPHPIWRTRGVREPAASCDRYVRCRAREHRAAGTRRMVGRAKPSPESGRLDSAGDPSRALLDGGHPAIPLRSVACLPMQSWKPHLDAGRFRKVVARSHGASPVRCLAFASAYRCTVTPRRCAVLPNGAIGLTHAGPAGTCTSALGTNRSP